MVSHYRELSQALLTDIAREGGSAHVDFTLARLRDRHQKRFPGDGAELRNTALATFEVANERARNTVIKLDEQILADARLFVVKAFENFASKAHPGLVQETFFVQDMFSRWYFGPGASMGVRGTHTAVKISQSMTATVQAESLVRRLRNTNSYFKSYDALNGGGVCVVSGSKLTTVPKNQETDRVIAIEPSGNSALQLALGVYVAEVLRSIGLDIKTQSDKNKALACKGSIDGSLATIDLKWASDLITPRLCELLLPRPVYDTMMLLRSDTAVMPCGKEIKFHMMSTMGNGFTFPIMTLLLVALIYATTERCSRPFHIDWTRVGVFGDDIICPTEQAPALIQVLEGAGLVVNNDKSFVTGTFRESCGGDFMDGYNCTPFYIKSLASQADVYIAINTVLEFCGRHNVLLLETLKYLRSLIEGELFFVPEWAQPFAGVRTTQVEKRYKHLAVKQQKVVLKNDFFAVMLIAGGYLTSSGSDSVFMPRPFKTRYRVRKSRLPNGYLDGRDPLTRVSGVSSFIESYMFLLK